MRLRTTRFVSPLLALLVGVTGLTAGLLATPAAQALPDAIPAEALSFADDFERADGALGNGWTSPGSLLAPAIAGGRVVAPGADDRVHAALRPTVTNRYAISLDMPHSWHDDLARIGAVLNLDADGNGEAVFLSRPWGTPSSPAGFSQFEHVEIVNWEFEVRRISPIGSVATPAAGTLSVERTGRDGLIRVRMDAGATVFSNSFRALTDPVGDSMAGPAVSGSGQIDRYTRTTTPTVTFASPPPGPFHVGDSHTVVVEASEPAARLTVTAQTPALCGVEGTVVTALAQGTCALQAIDGRTGATATQSFAVTQVPVTLDLGRSGGGDFVGDTLTMRAAVSSPRGIPAGVLSLTIDGSTTTTRASSLTGSLAITSLEPREVSATFVPDDAHRFAPAADGFLVRGRKWLTNTEVRLERDGIRVTVRSEAGVLPTPVPTGTVHVQKIEPGAPWLESITNLGSYPLVDGQVVVPGKRVPGHLYTARYAGDPQHDESTSPHLTQKPATMTATVHPERPTATGWYREPVTVSYACTVEGIATIDWCPATRTVETDGRDMEITEEFLSAEGAHATATVTVSLDRTPPTVAVVGLPDSGTYEGTPPDGECLASDLVSGVATCEVSHTVAPDGTVTYTATAVDRAGNSRASTRTLRLPGSTPPEPPTPPGSEPPVTGPPVAEPPVTPPPVTTPPPTGTPTPPTATPQPAPVVTGPITITGGAPSGAKDVQLAKGKRLTLTIKARTKPVLARLPRGVKATKAKRISKGRWRIVLTVNATKTVTIKLTVDRKKRAFKVVRLP
ncbi:hypothetical protein [Nocardioides campestrisoli]|uniref:hypothetical protein n=1 Tax=Nocardioides campestrisoli TaxID=2736757 RepID=UPI00163DE040|nr:hypothetical protein [Nocardioides campestrisoli]